MSTTYVTGARGAGHVHASLLAQFIILWALTTVGLLLVSWAHGGQHVAHALLTAAQLPLNLIIGPVRNIQSGDWVAGVIQVVGGIGLVGVPWWAAAKYPKASWLLWCARAAIAINFVLLWLVAAVTA